MREKGWETVANPFNIQELKNAQQKYIKVGLGVQL